MDKNTDNKRVINGVTYDVIRTKCNCICHKEGYKVKHIKACCNVGYVEHLVRQI